MNNDLKFIKKKYGEDMMHFCRQQFSTILEIPGLLPEILTESFAENKELYRDMVKEKSINVFIEYILFLFRKKHIVNIDKYEEEITKTPKELLDEAGYDLYECHTEEDIQQFRKYYAPEELLCTFDGVESRLGRCHVFFAVKKNVNDIKRENFKYPYRQDEYGTSVISIQFDRGKTNTVSIKNRYNHTVDYPDATFSNNLNNIIPGLKSSFENTYNLFINMEVISFVDKDPIIMDEYKQGNDNKYYKYYSETDEYYFCSSNNIVIDKETRMPIKYNKNEFIVFENYILDLKNKKFVLLEGTLKDSFLESLQDISKISVNPEGNLRRIEIFLESKEIPVIIKIDKNNQLVELENIYLETLDNNFLEYADKLKKLITPNVIEVGELVCSCAYNLEIIDISMVKKIGKYSFKNVYLLGEINMPNLEKIGDHVFGMASCLEKINTPKLRSIGDCSFMMDVYNLKEINMPSLEKVGACVFLGALCLERINAPRLRSIGDYSFENVYNLEEINMPNLEKIGDWVFLEASCLERINIPRLKNIGDHSFNNICIREKTKKLIRK